jgi:hypothetical protein
MHVSAAVFQTNNQVCLLLLCRLHLLWIFASRQEDRKRPQLRLRCGSHQSLSTFWGFFGYGISTQSDAGSFGRASRFAVVT